MDLKDAARSYFDRGFNVVAIAYGKPDESGKIPKIPLVPWQKWQTQRQTLEEFESQPWNKADGFAVICSFPNKDGLYMAVVDYDVLKVSEEAKERGRKLLSKFPTTQIEQSISGGMKLVYLSRVKPRAVSEFHDLCALELLAGARLCVMAPSKGYKRLNDNLPTVVEDAEGLFYEVLGIKDRREGKNEGVSREKLEKWLKQILDSGKIRVAGEGVNYFYAHCPFHDDQHPSFAIHKTKFYAICYTENLVLSLKELAEKLGIELADAEGRREIKIAPLSEVIAEAKPIEYLVEKIIPKRSLVMLCGKAGALKSTICLHIADTLAEGGKVFGEFQVVEQGRTLIFDEENYPSFYKQRCEMLGINPPEEVNCSILQGFTLDSKRCMEFLEQQLANKNYRLVVLDCWTNLVLYTDENKANEVSRVLTRLRRLAYEYDCTFLLTHHLRKNVAYVTEELDELRGSSVLVNEPDIVMAIRVDEVTGQRLVRMIKNRYCEPIAFRLALERNGSGRCELRFKGYMEEAEAESDVVQCAKVILDFLRLKKGAKRKEILQATKGHNPRNIDRALHYLIGLGEVERVKKGVYRLSAQQSKLESFNGSQDTRNSTDSTNTNNNNVKSVEKAGDETSGQKNEVSKNSTNLTNIYDSTVELNVAGLDAVQGFFRTASLDAEGYACLEELVVYLKNKGVEDPHKLVMALLERKQRHSWWLELHPKRVGRIKLVQGGSEAKEAYQSPWEGLSGLHTIPENAWRKTLEALKEWAKHNDGSVTATREELERFLGYYWTGDSIQRVSDRLLKKGILELDQDHGGYRVLVAEFPESRIGHRMCSKCGREVEAYIHVDERPVCLVCYRRSMLGG